MVLFEFMQLLIGAVPEIATYQAEFEGPLPNASDERYRTVCAAYRALPAAERCEAVEQMSDLQRSWLMSYTTRLAMLSIRLAAHAYLEDAILGLYLTHPAVSAEPDERRLWTGKLAVCARCAQLLGVGSEVFENQFPDACNPQTQDAVRRFLMLSREDQSPERWGFQEMTGDHGMIFLNETLGLPRAWLRKGA